MSRALCLIALLAACDDDASSPDAAPPAAPPAQAVEAPPADAPPAQADAGANQGADKALAPSPRDLDQSVRDAGLTTALPSLVPNRSFDMSQGSTDSVAVRTGVILADAILAGPEGRKDLFLRRLEEARAGLKRLGMQEGVGQLNEVDGFIAAVKDNTASRADFIVALDEMLEMKVPEESWAPGDTTGPLLQAGAWLAGTNLVAKAIVADDNAEAANTLLREESVVDYFITYVQTEGSDKAPDAVVSELTATLKELKVVAAKPTLTVADARAVAHATDKLLAQL